MRHATAGGTGGGSDHARSLTTGGRAEAVDVGVRLRELGWVPTRAIVSSAQRCQQTWAGVAEAFPTMPPADFRDAVYNAGSRELADAVMGEAQSDSDETVLLLAHNPGVSVFAVELAAGREEDEARLRGGFSPGSFACFEVEGDWNALSRRTVRLVHFERPSS